MESTSGIRPLFRFRLFVAGQEPNSLKAISVLTRLLPEKSVKVVFSLSPDKQIYL